MSTPAENPAETPEPAAQDQPTEHVLVDPTHVRRAPRYRAFFTIGALVGVVGGFAFAMWLVGSTAGAQPLLKPGVYVAVVVAAATTVTTLLAGALAILADRRSLRRR